MLIQLALLWAIGCMKGHSVGAIECYTCSNSSSLPSCSSLVQCPADSACSSEYTTVQGTRFYTLGCRNVLSCPTVLTPSTPSIVGRREAGASTNCSECCHSNHCNRQLCQDRDQHCADDVNYSCANVGSVIDICDEGSHIKPYCKRFCGFCNTVDGGWSHWSEWGNCDVTCGNGTRTKSRSCTGGSDCIGEKQARESCSKDLCPGPVVFFAKTLATTSLSVGDTLRFITVITNEGHGYDSSTGIFTAPVNGMYTFYVQFCTGSGQNVVVGLHVNNVRISFKYADSTNLVCGTLTVPVILKQRDKVQAMLEPGSGSPSLDRDHLPYRTNTFSGTLIH